MFRPPANNIQLKKMASDFDSVLFESMDAASFDSVAWVNRLLGAKKDEDDEALLNSVRTASTRLQTRSQELSRDAERIMERMLSVGPRAIQELDRVERVSLGGFVNWINHAKTNVVCLKRMLWL